MKEFDEKCKNQYMSRSEGIKMAMRRFDIS